MFCSTVAAAELLQYKGTSYKFGEKCTLLSRSLRAGKNTQPIHPWHLPISYVRQKVFTLGENHSIFTRLYGFYLPVKALIAERDVRLLSKTVWTSKQMFFPACRNVTSCPVDWSLFGEAVSPLLFRICQRREQPISFFPAQETFSCLSDKKKQIRDVDRAVNICRGWMLCCIQLYPRCGSHPIPCWMEHGGFPSTLAHCGTVQLTAHTVGFLCLLLARVSSCTSVGWH